MTDNNTENSFLAEITSIKNKEINCKIIKEFTNDQEYYYDTELDLVNNFNKPNFYENYSLYEKIYQLLRRLMDT